MTTVRLAQIDDLATISRLAADSAGAAQWSSAAWRQVFDPQAARRVVWVAERDSAVIGFAVVLAATEHWELENIVTAPQARRQGIGEALLRAALDTATRDCAKAIMLEVRESNMPARQLYRSCGFAEVGRRANYYSNPPEAAVLYSCSLAGSH